MPQEMALKNHWKGGGSTQRDFKIAWDSRDGWTDLLPAKLKAIP